MEQERIDYEDLDRQLQDLLRDKSMELEELRLEMSSIVDRSNVIDSISQVIWEQFILQIAGSAGSEFIEENRNLKLSLDKADHILSEQGFMEGHLPTHNAAHIEEYQARKEAWERSFADSSHHTLTHDARKPFDVTRDMGSSALAKDHTISVKEIIVDPTAATYMTIEEKVRFANDTEVNLKDLDARANQSKRDHPMEAWLSSTRDGKRPAERFDIDEEELRKRDKQAREAWQQRKDEAKEKAVEEGKQSLQEEAGRAVSYALTAVSLALLAKLTRSVCGHVVMWLKEKPRKTKVLFERLKRSIGGFFFDFKNNLALSADVALTVVLTQIFGEIISLLRKILLFAKIGGKTLLEVRRYLRDEENQHKPAEQVMLEVGKIAVAGLCSAGGVGLGLTITTLLDVAIPAFALVQIPLLGSPSSLIGIFLGGLFAGVSGVLLLQLFDDALMERARRQNLTKQNRAETDILALQDERFALLEKALEQEEANTADTLEHNRQIAEQRIEEIKASAPSMEEIRKRLNACFGSNRT